MRKIQAQACKESEKKIHALAKNASEKPIDGKKEMKKENLEKLKTHNLKRKTMQ